MYHVDFINQEDVVVFHILTLEDLFIFRRAKADQQQCSIVPTILRTRTGLIDCPVRLIYKIVIFIITMILSTTCNAMMT